MRVTFRCPPELEGLLPRPVPASDGLPGWVRSMPASAKERIFDGICRITADTPWRSRKMFTRNRAEPGRA
jgi:hypothetical protein